MESMLSRPRHTYPKDAISDGSSEEPRSGPLLRAMDIWRPAEPKEDSAFGDKPAPLAIDTQSPARLSEDGGFPFLAAPGAAAEDPTNPILGSAFDPALMSPIDEVPTIDEAGNIMSRGRNNVQFAPVDTEIPNGLTTSGRTRSSDTGTQRRADSFITRVKALGHNRRLSGPVGETPPPDPSTPQRSRENAFRSIVRDRPSSYAGEGDVISEDNQAEDGSASNRPLRRHASDDGAIETTATSARPKRHSRGSSGAVGESPSRFRKFAPRRAATLADIGNHGAGLSEDEGRERLSRQPGWRQRSSAWVVKRRGSSPNVTRRQSNLEGSDSRPGHLRRLTTMGGSSADGTRPGAQRWRQIKASLKMIGQQRKREENKMDQAKSAELMAELLAGSPAALIFASHFQRDEGNSKKVPVLLEQLKINITDGTNPKGETQSERHVIFRIELEYGSGLMRMKWVIYRSLGDFINLHTKCKFLSQKQRYFVRGGNHDPKRIKMPHFPRSAFPYMRGLRGLVADSDEEEEETGDEAGLEGATTPGRRPRQKRRGSSLNRINRQSTANSGLSGIALSDGAGPSLDGIMPNDVRKAYATRQRKKLEEYLRQLVRFLRFREGSNRLCKFLELSALGVRLAAESTYHGKEGYLTLQSGKGLDFRKAWKPSLLLQRHSPMWFMVRHSYLVCVDSLEEMNIYDVFLVDSDFEVQARRPRVRDQTSAKEVAHLTKAKAGHPQKHVLRLQNAERKIRLIARKEAHLLQFEESLKLMQNSTDWSKQHRFDSFAPVRRNVFAQWLVDGRDYMWNVSRAISMAQDVIYIHDWWLSPEIYMRRPAAISHKWRLDRLLKRKAEEGVKIFIIVYRNINSAIPIDSEYTKFSLLDLHPNVFVQRSPNQFRQNTFFWAHHEKICVVDHTIAFCGGVDLCFGRWDTPQHSVVDDKPTGFERKDMPLDSDHCQLFPGKDYSNPRVLDFFKLDEPYGEMYDRSKVPRMPWHDIGMQVVGQPARDLTRHFVQRWNYILRQRKPSRPTPFLLPPPDFAPGELEALGLDGTCDVQMLRSACDWSIGTPHRVEHSIQNAYCKLIETSDHFVYIENQFFISSCMVEGTRVRNHIGDAIVERAIRAARNNEKWKCVIVIPLMPGFQNTVEAQDGTSVRLIMQSQYASIDRGSTSIFERLIAEGIDPRNHVRFYSLRAWGKIGPQKSLVTEQLYIHAKCMVVDDRYAIIGSANINERSLLGERDSEIAALVYDNDMIDSIMAGEPYKVGRFPHSLRMRLMREHLGVDVDGVMDEEREEEMYTGDTDIDEGSIISDAQSERSVERKLIASKHRIQDDLIAKAEAMHSFNHDADWAQADNPHLRANKALTKDVRVTGNATHRADVDGYGFDKMADFERTQEFHGRETAVLTHDKEVLVNSVAPEGKGTLQAPRTPEHGAGTDSKESQHDDDDSATTLAVMPPARPQRLGTEEAGLTLVSQLPPLPAMDDTDIGGPPLERTLTGGSAEVINPLLASMRWPVVSKDCMRDPVTDAFVSECWDTVAQNNTKLFRQVFRCMPDSQVTTWDHYNAAVAYAERFAHSQGMPKSTAKMQEEARGRTGPPGHGAATLLQPHNAIKTKIDNANVAGAGVTGKLSALFGAGHTGRGDPSDMHQSNESNQAFVEDEEPATGLDGSRDNPTRVDFDSSVRSRDGFNGPDVINEKQEQDGKRRKRATTKSSAYSDHMPTRDDSEQILDMIQGSLVEWPYDW